jgi:hypothetical protein
LSQTGKFVQFFKASEPVVKGTETITSVNMKISVSSLRDLLAQEGLLYQNEGPPTVLPLIKIIEKKDSGRQYTWWTEEVGPNTQFLRDEEKEIVHLMDSVFRPKNFYVMDPLTSHYVQWVPTFYRNENPTQEQLQWLGDFFRSQIVVSGEAILEKGSVPENVKLNARVIAYHSSNGRIVGEVSRTFEVTSRDWDQGVALVLKKGFIEVGRDLSGQIQDESTKGTLGATVMLVTLHGNFNYQDLENFKKQIMIKVGDVKALRERRQERGVTSFEVDFAGPLPSLVKSLESNTFEGFKLGVQRSGDNEVELHWSK